MKRSEINSLIRDAQAFFKAHRFELPRWAVWSPEEWARHPEDARRMKSLQMGWDITDFGSGDFYRTGLILFCIRNGKPGAGPGGKVYAEKIMVVREEQETPLHFHFSKQEDIINRGGGDLVVELHNADAKEGLAATPVTVSVDERPQHLRPGAPLVLKPGESVTLPTRLYHRFYGAKGRGKVLVGEVSQVNDDTKDNRFLTAPGRFPAIVEDEPALHPLWPELPG